MVYGADSCDVGSGKEVGGATLSLGLTVDKPTCIVIVGEEARP